MSETLEELQAEIARLRADQERRIERARRYMNRIAELEKREQPMLMALGDYRVGVGFNPSGSDDVARIKRLAADLINFLELKREQIGGRSGNDRELTRLFDAAQLAIEDGAMWGVKAVTKPPRPPAVPGPFKPALAKP